MPLLVASPKCSWLKHLAGTGISLNLRGKGYKSKGKGWSGRGCAVGFGSAASASKFIADGNVHSMAVRVANDRDLALEINHRKFEVGGHVSVWSNDGHPEYAVRFTVNADHSLTPLDNSGKPQKHLAVGIKKGTTDAILVRMDDAEQKVTFSFGEDMSSRLSHISKLKEQAKTQMKELHNFPMLLLSPACDAVGQGMKALCVDNNEWKDKKKKSRGRMVSVGTCNIRTFAAMVSV